MLAHLQINVSNPQESFPFYKDLLSYFGYQTIDEGDGHLGLSNGTVDIWLIETEADFKKNGFHRKNPGINHLAFQVERKEDLDRITDEFLKKRNIMPLYDSPKAFPEYSDTYHALFFEDPDRIKIEVVFK